MFRLPRREHPLRLSGRVAARRAARREAGPQPGEGRAHRAPAVPELPGGAAAGAVGPGPSAPSALRAGPLAQSPSQFPFLFQSDLGVGDVDPGAADPRGAHRRGGPAPGADRDLARSRAEDSGALRHGGGLPGVPQVIARGRGAAVVGSCDPQSSGGGARGALGPQEGRLGRVRRIPVHYDMAEVYPEFLKSLHAVAVRPWWDRVIRSPRAAALVERWVLKRAGSISVVSEESRGRCVRLGAPADRVVLVGNTPENLEELTCPRPFPAELRPWAKRSRA